MSIVNRAVLVELNCPTWTAKVKDKKASRDAQMANQADQDSGDYIRNVMRPQDIAPIKQKITEARSYHYKKGLPWSRGIRIISTEILDEYSATMRGYRREVEEIVSKTAERIDDLKALAKRSQGNLFQEDEFPTKAQLLRKYGINVTVYTVPERSDLEKLVGLTDEERATMIQEAEEVWLAKMQRSMNDVWARIHRVCSHAVERLDKPRARFWDSLIDNIKELVEILPQLNLTNDPNLEAARKRLEEEVCDKDPDELRDDPKARQKTADAVRKIEEDFGSFFPKGDDDQEGE